MYLQVVLKDKPEDYHGVKQEYWRVGANDELGLADAVVGILLSTQQLYLACYDADTLNAELAKLRERLGNIEFAAIDDRPEWALLQEKKKGDDQ